MNKYDKLGVAILFVLISLGIMIMGIGVGASFILTKLDDIKYEDEKAMIAMDIMEITLAVLGIVFVIYVGVGLIVTAVN